MSSRRSKAPGGEYTDDPEEVEVTEFKDEEINTFWRTIIWDGNEYDRDDCWITASDESTADLKENE